MKPFWITPTYQNVMSRFNAAEKSALAALQADPEQLGQVLSDVVDSARGSMKAGGNQLGPDGTAPLSLIPDIIAITLWRWLQSFPKNDKLQTDGRKDLYKDALSRLKEVASGKLKVELPDPGETDTTAAPVNAIQVASRERRQFKRNQMKGF